MKLFCSHKWKTHAKKKYNWMECRTVAGTEWWYKPIQEEQMVEETIEIIICDKCGKVKKIKY